VTIWGLPAHANSDLRGRNEQLTHHTPNAEESHFLPLQGGSGMKRPSWMPGPTPAPLDLRQAKPGERAFGLEWSILTKGGISAAIELFFGLDKRDRRKREKLAQQQAEALTRALAACPSRRTREGVLALHLQLAADLKKVSGKGWRVQGSAGFFGNQHYWCELEGKRKYLQKRWQGGMAERLGVTVRTIFKWWAYLRHHGVWASEKPARTEKHALLNRNGTQVYTQRRLVGGTPQVVRDRLPPHELSRPADRPDPDDIRPMRGHQWREALAWLEGWHVPY
jgi:hypothetical protein